MIDTVSIPGVDTQYSSFATSPMGGCNACEKVNEVTGTSINFLHTDASANNILRFADNMLANYLGLNATAQHLRYIS